MDELDLLKKDWQKRANNFAEVSESEIYRMLHTKSSSLVKWILIISIIEVAFWVGLGLAVNSDDLNKLNFEHTKLCLTILNVVNYTVVLAFIYLFYKNYVSISTTESTRTLMKNILRTRKTVHYYVGYNLVTMVLTVMFGFYLAFNYSSELSELRAMVNDGNHQMLTFMFILFLLVALSVLFVLLWLFYRLVYGTLLKKLYANYSELKKIDLS